MDPVTAVCQAITAICTLASELAKANPAVAADVLKRADDNIIWLRSLVHLPPT